MKILFLTLGVYHKSGGIERYCSHLIDLIKEAEQVESFNVLSLWDESSITGKGNKKFKFLFANSSKIKMIRLLFENLIQLKPDIILVGHVLFCPVFILLRILRLKSRIILLTYGYEVWNETRFRRSPILERWITRKIIDQVISISKFTAIRMSKEYKIPYKQFYILPPVVDISSEKDNTPKIMEKSGLKIITVARLDESYKGIDKILYVLPDLIKIYPKLIYEIVGEGPLKKIYVEYAKILGISNNVNFLGFVGESKLVEIYNNARIFVMPSTGEGFGIVFLEAWRHRIPVICGNSDASSEVVTDGKNGFTVSPDDPDQLKNSILKLLSNDELVDQMGNAGYKTMMEKYSCQKFSNELFHILLGINQKCVE